MTTETGGPAFPETGERGKAVGGEGMTMRDYFAAKAMQGIISSGCTVDIDGDYIFQKRAKTAYLIADAMIKAREEQ